MNKKTQTLKSIAGVCGLNSSTILAGTLVGTLAIMAACFGLAVLLDGRPRNPVAVARSKQATTVTAAQQPSTVAAVVDTTASTEPPVQDDPAPIETVTIREEDLGPTIAEVESQSYQQTVPQLQLSEMWGERDRQQRQLWAAATASIEQKIRERQRDCDIEPFVSEIRTFTSMANAVTNTAQHRQSMMTKLDKNVFCLQTLEKMLAQELNTFHQQLSKLDDACLVQLEIDCGQDFGQLNYAEYKILPDEFIPASLVDWLHSSTYSTIVEVIATQGAGYAVGTAVEQSVRNELAYDERGNYSFAGELEAVLWGFAAGVATEMVTQTAFDTAGALREKLTSASRTVFESLLRSDSAWRDSLTSIIATHNATFLITVAERSGTDVHDLIETTRQD